FAHLAAPSTAWHADMGSPALYWTLQLLALLTAAGVAVGGWTLVNRLNGRAGHGRRRSDDPVKAEGLATRGEVRRAASARALLHRAATLRPSVHRPTAGDVGLMLGHARGVACWASVEDSVTVLGPPRSGKGYHLVIPWVIDYPGAVITTSTRADNLTAAIADRASDGRPVGVFDPQGLAAGVPSALRWSPIRGCENPQTAMIRAAGLVAGADEGVSEGSFWKQRAQTAVRCLLHAAAIANRPPAVLYEWSLSAPRAQEAVQLLQNAPDATVNWDKALDGIVRSDQRQRDSVWGMVDNAFAALADPRVLDAVSPTAEDHFDPADFLRRRGALFLLGTATGASATAGLVSALIEDVVEVARRAAAASPGARLDPPLGLLLDESANFPLPSLPALMSEGGGSGITTVAVLQSLAQARAKWGREQAEAIWDSSIVKIVLGGSSNADDLQDLSRMLGDQMVAERSRSWQDGQAGRSWSESERERAILDPSMIRRLPFGRALLVLRSARPIVLRLTAWEDRPDGDAIKHRRAQVELTIRNHAASQWGARA
ncbi:MAG: type IV secretory system conjugative DNA transfer family protein, partial [Solirubrobacteraceae bacterium]